MIFGRVDVLEIPTAPWRVVSDLIRVLDAQKRGRRRMGIRVWRTQQSGTVPIGCRLRLRLADRFCIGSSESTAYVSFRPSAFKEISDECLPRECP
jgi:hypothetical protein